MSAFRPSVPARRSHRVISLTVFLVILASILALTVAAQGPKPTNIAKKAAAAAPAPATSSGTHELTASDVEAFLDGVVPAQLRRSDIAGAVVAVVKDGKLLYAQGYGYADYEKRKPVSADDTLFRPGSISKLFTWTSVMQQVEQGKINLDANVNDYLDFKIPDTYPQPITIRNLMTHTPGFEEAVMDLFVPNGTPLVPLGKYLATHTPKRIFPPGTTPAYSNYGASLAGYIVQRVSGEQFDDYVKNHILDPLDMHKTTFDQPLPANLEPLMSKGYTTASAGGKKFEFVQSWPAGSSSVTASDITHFMIAHLQNGSYNGAQILKPETAQLMHSRQYAANPAMPAMCLGFYEETRNGHRIIGHGGDTEYFHSDLHLILDSNVGFFVSYNSAGKGEGSNRTALFEAFLNRYFPYTPPADPTPSTAAQDGSSVAGTYLVSRRSEHNMLAALGMVGEAKVYPNSDNTISVDALKDFSGNVKKFREVAPLVYREVNGQDKIAFNKNYAGQTVLSIDYPFMVFQRIGFIRNKTWNMFLLFASIAVLALMLILWPVAAIARRHYGITLNVSRENRRLRWLVRLTCLLDLIFIGALVGLLSSLSEPGALNSSLDPRLHLLQVIGVLGVVGCVAAIWYAMRTWTATPTIVPMQRAAAAGADGPSDSSSTTSAARFAEARFGLLARLSATVVALACLGFSWFIVYWGLLNFNLNF